MMFIHDWETSLALNDPVPDSHRGTNAFLFSDATRTDDVGQLTLGNGVEDVRRDKKVVSMSHQGFD